MSERVTNSVAQEQQEQKIATSTAATRTGGFTIVATAVAALAVLAPLSFSRKARTTTSTR